MTFIVENSDVTINMTVYQSDGVTAYNLTGAEYSNCRVPKQRNGFFCSCLKMQT